MVLDFGKALSFFVAIGAVAIAAFFEPATRWDQRLLIALPRLTIAACLCLASGLLFSWPARSNPDSSQPLLSTLPIRLFFWSLAAMALLFAVNWYLACGGPGCGLNAHNCG